MAELVDTNSASAKASDILKGKTAYVKSGLVEGTISKQSGSTVVPGTASKTVVERGKYMTSDIVMAGDVNLVPENIAKDVTIFGVKGTWEGEPPPPTLPEGFYKINVSSDNEDEELVSGGGVASRGMNITVSAKDKWYATFKGWEENGSAVSESKDYIFNVESDRNLTATFDALPRYNISATAIPMGGGEVSGTGMYYETEEVALNANENRGYSFAEWKENGETASIEKTYKFTAERSRDLIAEFEELPLYAITATIEPSGVGTVEGAGQYYSGENVELKVLETNDEYMFREWKENGSSVSNNPNYSFVAERDRDLTAAFMDKYPAGVSWYSTDLPSRANWSNVAYGGGKFVAIASGVNVAACSADGVNWTPVELPLSAAWVCITYGDGKFVAVANGDTVAYSTDGISWDLTAMKTSATWTGIAYGNGKFVAVANYSSKCAYSVDGINWEESALPYAGWCGVDYGNGMFVATAQDTTSTAAYSVDGVNWTRSTMPLSANWYGIAYGNGMFVAAGSGDTNAFAYSANGMQWAKSSTIPSLYVKSISYGNGVFVAVGGITTVTSVAYYSTDGINWARTSMPSMLKWRGATYGDGVFVAVGSDTSGTIVSAYSVRGRKF